MASYDQSGRLLRIDTTVGPNKVLLVDLDGTEALSQPFLYNITLASDEGQDKLKKLLGEAVTVSQRMSPLPCHVIAFMRQPFNCVGEVSRGRAGALHRGSASAITKFTK